MQGERTSATFLLSSQCPENLLGLDLLKHYRATIRCSPNNVRLILYDNVTPSASAQLLQLSHMQDDLATISPCLWATSDTDVGSIQMPPVHITVKPGVALPRIPQYKISKEGEVALQAIVQDLILAGVVEQVSGNVCNSPILPVLKRSPTGQKIYRFVIDLRAINKIVQPQFPVVSDITTILTMIPPTARVFTVIDLKNAFFSIPIHKDSRFLFGFTLMNVSYRFCRAPQGYTESPSLYSQALKTQLDQIQLPQGVALIQYVDDILLAADTTQLARKASMLTLQFLATKGHKVSKDKLQYCRQQVTYLGHLLSEEGRTLTPDRIQTILNFPTPVTQRDVRALIGLTSFCRQWVPNFSLIIKPLLFLVTRDVSDPVPWTTQHTEAFMTLRQALCSAPVLGTPDYQKRFFLFVHERSGCSLSLLCQTHGTHKRPCAYFSAVLDPVASALPTCLRAVAAAAVAVRQTEGIVLGSPLTVLVPHSVDILLNKTKTQHLTSARLHGYELTLLNPHITIQRCTTLNPATLLPLPAADPLTQPPHHDCMFRTEAETKSRVDLKDTAFPEAEGHLWVDGSCLKLPDGTTSAAYAVTTALTVIETARILQKSAQAAEITALTRACILSTNMSVNIYTDSQYAFGVVHNFALLWKERGFLTSHGTPIQHGNLINALLEAITLPTKLAVIKCAAHKRVTDEIGQGNALADKIARQTALGEVPAPVYVLKSQAEKWHDARQQIIDIQRSATPEEKGQWETDGMVDEEGCWRSQDMLKWKLPQAYVIPLLTMTHLPAHIGSQAMCTMLKEVWDHPRLRPAAERFVKQCLTCLQHNIGQGTKVPMAGFALPTAPFEVLQMDYIQLNRVNSYKYALVVVCAFSKWVEAYPTKDNTAITTAKVLLKEFFPRYGLCRLMQSDRGSHFIGQTVKHILEGLGVKQKFHAAFHPEAAGLVERYNGILKEKLAKITTETGLNWVNALPLALLSIRSVPHSKSHLTPYEVVFGRPMNIWNAPSPKSISELPQEILTDYLYELTETMSLIHEQVRATTEDRSQGPGHHILPGHFVLVKNFARTQSLQPRWKGPLQVLLVTRTAIRVEGRKSWVHASHCRKVDPITKEQLQAQKEVLEHEKPVLSHLESDTELELCDEGSDGYYLRSKAKKRVQRDA